MGNQRKTQPGIEGKAYWTKVHVWKIKKLNPLQTYRVRDLR